MSQPGKIRAFWDALLGTELAHYPREDGVRLDPKVILSRISTHLKDVQFPSAQDAKTYIDRAKDSLEEAKKLTEYQDQKVSRLLTIIAFLTAAAGTIFSKVVDTYPLHQYVDGPSVAGCVLVVIVYGLFGAYLLFVAGGALVTFYATQTRFVWAKDEPEDANANSVKSFLFFRSILTTKPEAWAAAFLKASVPSEPSDSMLADYYKNYIAEAYLVAAKVGDKLRYLQPAQAILLVAIRLLLAWLLAMVTAFAFLPPVAKASSDLTAATSKKVESPSANSAMPAAVASQPNSGSSTGHATPGADGVQTCPPGKTSKGMK